MTSIMDTLGLDQVKSDPNDLPDGRWAGTVFKSELVFNPKSNVIAHVITYKVTEGDRKGAQRQDWNTLGTDPVFAEGHKGEVAHLVSMTNSMDETAKRWYKKVYVDLGVPESAFDKEVKPKPADLVGKDVTFGTKRNGQFINISFVQLRNPVAQTSQAVAQPGQTATGTVGLI